MRGTSGRPSKIGVELRLENDCRGVAEGIAGGLRFGRAMPDGAFMVVPSKVVGKVSLLVGVKLESSFAAPGGLGRLVVLPLGRSVTGAALEWEIRAMGPAGFDTA